MEASTLLSHALKKLQGEGRLTQLREARSFADGCCSSAVAVYGA